MLNFEVDQINSPQRPQERITVEPRLTPLSQENLYKRLKIIQSATSIQGMDLIPFTRYNSKKTAGRTLEKPSEGLQALDPSKETVHLCILEGKTECITLTSKNTAKSRNTRLKCCLSPLNKLWNGIPECGSLNQQRDFETAGKLELS